MIFGISQIYLSEIGYQTGQLVDTLIFGGGYVIDHSFIHM